MGMIWNDKTITDEVERVFNILNERLEKVESELSNPDYLEWKAMAKANKDTAAKQGYFYLNSKADTQLLESVISEINQNEDLTALFKTSDGATLSLRVHPQPKENIKKYMGGFDGDE